MSNERKNTICSFTRTNGPGKATRAIYVLSHCDAKSTIGERHHEIHAFGRKIVMMYTHMHALTSSVPEQQSRQ